MGPPRTLGARLRAWRLAADMTLEGLAERSGVSARTLSDIERGVSLSPQRRTITAIADGLGLESADREGLLKVARARRQHLEPGDRAAAIAPHRLSDFTGRVDEIAAVLSFVDSPEARQVTPVVIIAGPPGVGKTAAAFEALSRALAPGASVAFVDLDGFNALPLTPLQVLRALLRQMPGIGEHLPTSLEAAARLWAETTAHHRPLVLLDNAANESQIRPVLACRTRGVVVTSRRTLGGLEGAHRLLLRPLDETDSALLLDRLIPVVQRDVDVVRELAALCDHVPLALRIAGNRIASRPAMHTRHFVERMRVAEDRLRLLTSGDLAIESAIALSYDDLEPDTAEIFRTISVIEAGTFDARIAAAALGGDVTDTESRLDDLTELGMLEARGGMRYRMHDHLRYFASARLRSTAGQFGVGHRRNRLRGWLLDSLERAGSWFEPHREGGRHGSDGMVFASADSAAGWIRLEAMHWWPALQTAAVVGEHAVVADVADALHWFSDLWLEWGQWHEFFSLAAASSAVLQDPTLQATHLGYLAWAEIVERRDRPAALATARKALEAADLAADDSQRGWAQFYACWAATDLESYDEAAAAGRESIAAFTRSGDEQGLAQAMVITARAHSRRGDYAKAVADYELILHTVHVDSHRPHDVVRLITAASVLSHLSEVQLALARPLDAITSATASLVAARELDSAMRIAPALYRRTAAQMVLGEMASAEADITEGLAILGLPSKDAYMEELRLRLETLRSEMLAGNTTLLVPG